MEATAPARPQAIPPGPMEKRGQPFSSTQGLRGERGCTTGQLAHPTMEERIRPSHSRVYSITGHR